MKDESLQRLDVFDEWTSQMHHEYCKFHREHPPVAVRPITEEMVIDADSLEKALEKATLKVAQRESEKEKNTAITNTIKSWLNKDEDVVQRLESTATWSDTASHISYALHRSCRKEIAKLKLDDEAIKFYQERLISLFTMGRTFVIPFSPRRIRRPDLQVQQLMEPLKFFHSRPKLIPEAEDKKITRTKLKERVIESKHPKHVLEARKKEKKETLMEKRYTDPLVAAQVLLA